MLTRKCFVLLLIVKMSTSQSVYPTTAVSYSTNSVPTIQTLPVSTVGTIPSTVSAISATVSPVPAIATAMPTSATVTTLPITGSTPVTPTVTSVPYAAGAVKVTAMPPTANPLPSSMSPKVSLASASPSVVSSSVSEPKAYFLPASIPDPKVTILPHDHPTAFGDSSLYNDPYVVNHKDDGSMSPVKRLSLACDEDFFVTNDEPSYLGIPKNKNDIRPPPGLNKNRGSLNSPIGYEDLVDGFFSCL